MYCVMCMLLKTFQTIFISDISYKPSNLGLFVLLQTSGYGKLLVTAGCLETKLSYNLPHTVHKNQQTVSQVDLIYCKV